MKKLLSYAFYVLTATMPNPLAAMKNDSIAVLSNQKSTISADQFSKQLSQSKEQTLQTAFMAHQLFKETVTCPDEQEQCDANGYTRLHVIAEYNLDGFSHDIFGCSLEELPPLWLENLTKNKAETDRLGQTPLHHAVANRNLSLARVLITHGADVQAKGFMGSTPLDLAAENGDIAMANVLLEKGAHKDDDQKRNCTFFYPINSPLHRAAKKGHLSMITLLVAQGARVDNRDEEDYTPLDLALIHNPQKTNADAEKLITIIKALTLHNGNYRWVNLGLRNYYGHSLLNRASHPKIKELLLDIYCKTNDAVYDTDFIDCNGVFDYDLYKMARKRLPAYHYHA